MQNPEFSLHPSPNIIGRTTFDLEPNWSESHLVGCWRATKDGGTVKGYQPEELDCSTDAMLAAQGEGTEIKNVCHWMEISPKPPVLKNVLPLSGIVRTYLRQWPVLTLRDGLLHRRWESADGLHVVWQWVPHVRYRSALIQLSHGGMTGGHQGVARTQAQLRRRAYWVKWKADVQCEVRRCSPCAQYIRGTPPRQAGLRPMLVGEPWEQVAIDITGKHPKSRNGSEYMLTVMDHFGKWVEAYPLRDHNRG